MAVLPLLLVGFLAAIQPDEAPIKENLSARDSLIAEIEARQPTGPQLSFRWNLSECTEWTAQTRTITKSTDSADDSIIEESTVRFIIGERDSDGWLVFIDAGGGENGLVRWRDDGWIRRDGRNQDARPWIFQATGIWIPDTHTQALHEDTRLNAPPPHHSIALDRAIFQLELTDPSARLDERGGAFWRSVPVGVDVIRWFQDAVGGPVWNGTRTQIVRGSVQLPNGWLGDGALEYTDTLSLTDGAQSMATATPTHRIEWQMKEAGSACFSTDAPGPVIETIPRQQAR